MQYFYHLFLLFFLTKTGCTPVSSELTNRPQKKSGQESVFAIKNVNVIPMTSGGEILPNATVIIKGKKIVSLNGSIPDQAEIIDGKGRWLIPGLIDMHVHIPTDINFSSTFPTQAATIFFDTQDVMIPYVVNGVTTILDLNSKAEHFGQRNDIARGDVIGPRMALAALINGGDGSGRIANTPSDGSQAVRIAKAEGYEFIKVYSQLNIETYHAIINEASKQNIKVIGHIPDAFRGTLKEAFVSHFSMVAHAEEFAKQTEYFSDQDVKRFAQLVKENGTWLTPTLTAIVSIAAQARSLDAIRNLESLQYVHPILQSKWLTSNNYNKNASPELIAYFDKIIDFNARLIKAFKEAGVPIVAGTDTGVSGVVGGFSLHDELQLLVDAGLTPQEALTSATCLPANWLGIDSKVGTIEAGKFADLVLLEANPLINIKNTRKIAGVFVNGRWLSKSRMSTMLSDLAKRNIASKDKYDWNKRREY